LSGSFKGRFYGTVQNLRFLILYKLGKTNNNLWLHLEKCKT
jgi:hypothetical protein